MPAETPGCRGEQPGADREAAGLGLGDTSAVSGIPKSPPLSAAWPAAAAATEARRRHPFWRRGFYSLQASSLEEPCLTGTVTPSGIPCKDGPLLLWTDWAALLTTHWNEGATWGWRRGRAPSGSGGGRWPVAAGLPAPHPPAHPRELGGRCGPVPTRRGPCLLQPPASSALLSPARSGRPAVPPPGLGPVAHTRQWLSSPAPEQHPGSAACPPPRLQPLLSFQETPRSRPSSVKPQKLAAALVTNSLRPAAGRPRPPGPGWGPPSDLAPSTSIQPPPASPFSDKRCTPGHPWRPSSQGWKPPQTALSSRLRGAALLHLKGPATSRPVPDLGPFLPASSTTSTATVLAVPASRPAQFSFPRI